MKTQNKIRLTTGIVYSILAASVMYLATSCVRKVAFRNSSVVPAAIGTVKVKRDDNNNHHIKVKIQDLAEVGRLELSKQTYVVWMETDKGNTENLGQLKSSSSFFSKQKTAFLDTVSSFKPIKIFVTAEHERNVRIPGDQIILSTDKF